MNTTKQVNVMIGLLFMSFLVFGAYMATEGAREADARDQQAEQMALRGARLYVANCRACHGLQGKGPDDGGIAPALNTVAFLVLEADNALHLKETPAGEARNVREFIFNTVACGRSNTAMPVWSERYGGPLSDTQVNYIVSLVTQARWDLLEEAGHEHDAPIIAQHAAALAMFNRPYDDPTLPVDQNLSKDQKKAVDAAITAKIAPHYEDLTADAKKRVDEALKKSILVPDPSKLSVTSKNCGQYGGSVLEFRERNPLLGPPAGGDAKPADGAAAGGDPVRLGLQVATANGCVACHTPNGQVSVGPTWKGLFDSNREFVSGSPVKADEAYLKESILTPNARVSKGFLPNLMPATYATTLKPEQIDQIIAYIKSLK